MSRPRKLIKPVRYNLIIEEETLYQFKRMVNIDGINAPDVIRTLIDDYIAVNTNRASYVRSEADITRGIKDQVDVLLKNHSFKLNDLVTKGAKKAIKDLRSFYAGYVYATMPMKYHIPIGYGEYLHVRFSEDSQAIITSTAHDIVIRQKGYFIYIDMPNIYTDTDDEIVKFCMLQSLMVTIDNIAINYKDNMLIAIR